MDIFVFCHVPLHCLLLIQESEVNVPRSSKAVRPAVLAMQKGSMDVILRNAEMARGQGAPLRASAPVVLRGKLRSSLAGESQASCDPGSTAEDGGADTSI
jgi:hypothetical protein